MTIRNLLRALLVATTAAIGVAANAAAADAAFFPDALAPPAPFPLIVEQSLEREFVAPGIERGVYHLQTSAGPLVVSLVAFDPREPTLRIETVLAHDRIVSAGETVSSMAARTGAVAGINADYFDIGNTNAPLGVLVQHGSLVRTPSGRTAFTVGSDNTVAFAPLRVHGSATDNGQSEIPITSVNVWPPEGGAALITPAYGVPAAASGTVVAELTPIATPTSAAQLERGALAPSGRYRVTQIDSGTAPVAPTYALGLGPAAQNGLAVLPDVGDLIDVALDADPPFDRLTAAVGGGPALLQDGAAVDDPASPGYAERARRIPVAAAAALRDGGVAFIVVDGRRPAISIGVDRAELIALLTGLGAHDAMQFDSGGSATLVTRVLGETQATVANDPSDGVERPVADGVFVYSDAPTGPPARLVVRPARIEALPDTEIPLRSALVDAAGHALGPARGAWHVDGGGASIETGDVLRTGPAPLTTTLHVERDGVATEIPLTIVASAAKISIAPEHPDIDPGGTLILHAQAFDERGFALETGDRIRWSALRGSITAGGVLTADRTDAFVSATLGDVKSSELVHVGRHREALPGFDAAGRTAWRFTTVPPGGAGSLSFTPQGTLEIAYDFSGDERAAYAAAGLTLGEPLAISCAVDGDGGAAGVRVALVDRYGERTALTLAKTIDWTGLQRREVRVPQALAPPIVLQSFYVVGTLGGTPVKSSGTIGIRACEVTQPGTVAPAP